MDKMDTVKNFLGHLHTINAHKAEVMRLCFRVGLYRQGLLHDLSKYTPGEFLSGVKYYDGSKSPNSVERNLTGKSEAWLHHKGRNRHHFEYWTDYGVKSGAPMEGIKMPVRYVVEMFCDRVAASKTYNPDTYDCSYPFKYFMKNRGHYMMHPDTERLLGKLLLMLMLYGEDDTLRYIRNRVLKNCDKY